MKKIIIIEDDEIKYNLIREGLECEDVEWKRSYQSGSERIMKGNVDRIILDMTLPIYDVNEDEGGFEHLVFAGELIMDEMLRKNIILPVVVVTQYGSFFDNGEEVSFEDLKFRLLFKFKKILRGVVYLEAASPGWKEELRKCLK